MTLEQYQHIHLVGIGGVGMKAIAHVLCQKGFTVSGSDRDADADLDCLRQDGAHIFSGHDAANIDGAEAIVVSTAIPADNPEVVAARKQGIPVFHRSDIVTALMNNGLGIAVAGAHGKTTTTSMIGRVCEEANNQSTIIIGGEVDYLQGNSKLGDGPYVVAEADESDGSFLKLTPHIAVVTNIEDDHLDYYGSLEHIREAFLAFVHRLDPRSGLAVICGENENNRSLLAKIERPYVTYGFSDAFDYQATDIGYTDGKMHFTVKKKGVSLGNITLRIPGEHNVLNALATVIVGLEIGISFAVIAAGLADFHGTKRRFQTLLHNDNIWLIDDYAHHPTEIQATLRAVREVAANRLICVFQPHRYTRTQLLQDEFAAAFDAADILVFTDVYSAGEQPIPGIDGALLARLVTERAHNENQEIRYVADKKELPTYLQDLVHQGDMMIVMGAGDICECGYALARQWK